MAKSCEISWNIKRPQAESEVDDSRVPTAQLQSDRHEALQAAEALKANTRIQSMRAKSKQSKRFARSYLRHCVTLPERCKSDEACLELKDLICAHDPSVKSNHNILYQRKDPLKRLKGLLPACLAVPNTLNWILQVYRCRDKPVLPLLNDQAWVDRLCVLFHVDEMI